MSSTVGDKSCQTAEGQRLQAAHDAIRHSPRPPKESPSASLLLGTRISASNVERRWNLLPDQQESHALLLDPQTQEQMPAYQGNIENFIGTVKIPVGLAGPLRVHGAHACGDYYIPLATTEAALVASYDRGARLISAAGGCTALLLEEGVGRAPGFAFRSLTDSALFVDWVRNQIENLRHAAAGTTQHGRLLDIAARVEGNHVYLHLQFSTGDAAGQNMVTIATAAVCRYITEHCPVQPHYVLIDANLGHDKKATTHSFLRVRGRGVTAEAIIPEALLVRWLHTTPQDLAKGVQMALAGGVMSGTVGFSGQFANGLAALFLACGQDVACVTESAVGMSRCEITPEGDLYATVTLPNLIVGTVGGGTRLPSQNACLQIMGLAGEGKAHALAEVCAAVCLAGDLSMMAALCSGHFVRAHKVLSRTRARSQAQSQSGE